MTIQEEIFYICPMPIKEKFIKNQQSCLHTCKEKHHFTKQDYNQAPAIQKLTMTDD